MTARALHGSHPSTPSGLHIRVFGPDSPDAPPELAPLLAAGGHLPGGSRHFDESVTVAAYERNHLAGCAAYVRQGDELRIYALSVPGTSGMHTPNEIVRRLLEAIELAGLAGGCRRLVVLPRAVIAASAIERLGYRVISEGCAGAWLEKVLN